MYLNAAALLAHRGRTEGFLRAIDETVRPGDVAVDLGCGAGVFTLFLLRAGARRVYAIDPSDEAEMARELVRANGFGDRVVFVAEDSRFATIPERADVVLVDEIFDSFFVGRGVGAAIVDARERFLAPPSPEGMTARLIPSAVRLLAAPVEASEIRAGIDPLGGDGNRYGLDFTALRRPALNEPYVRALGPGALLADPVEVAAFDLTAATEISVDRAVSFEAARAGTLDGVAGWFEARLSASVTLSNDPRREETPWNQFFFPVERPVAVGPGDRIAVRFRSSRQAQSPFGWAWDVEVGDERFAHSTVEGSLRLPRIVRALAADARPRLSAAGRAERLVLDLCDGTRGPDEIAAEVARRCPEACPTIAKARALVGEVLLRSPSPVDADRA